ncbi:MAG: sigma-54-dependent Fis family transcriptional regulator [Spirochaetaceae bacterium]|nr:MAG: sigma-54-dependent Fis family transcriptional regulator [Spirochaetaceae bacterium]
METAPSVLIVGDYLDQLDQLAPAIEEELECRVTVVEGRESLTRAVREDLYDVVLLDHRLTGDDPSVCLVHEICTYDPELSVVVLTEMEDLERVLTYLKHGAADCVLKQSPRRVVEQLGRLISERSLRSQSKRLRRHLMQNHLENPYHFSQIVTADQRMVSLLMFIESVAWSSHPVLITGESGTGKDLMASAVHQASGRSGPFVIENVAGLDDTLFSDALFGHVRGAFTGAVQDRSGLVDRAAGGTLFLDEIGDLDIKSQIKLLRLLEHGEFFRLGSDAPRRTDVRFVVATNRNLDELMSTGRFRKDLFYRLSTHEIAVPPLRERQGDVRLLAHHFVARFCLDSGTRLLPLEEGFVATLERYPFPGNVRELQAVILHALAAAGGTPLRAQHLAGFHPSLDDLIGTHPGPVCRNEILFGDDLPSMRSVSDLLIDEALRRAGGNQSEAARMIGVTPSAISKRLKRLRTREAPE